MANLPLYSRITYRIQGQALQSDYYRFPQNLLPTLYNGWVPDGYDYDYSDDSYRLRFKTEPANINFNSVSVIIGAVEGDPITHVGFYATLNLNTSANGSYLRINKSILEEWFSRHKEATKVSVFLQESTLPGQPRKYTGVEVYAKHQMPTVTTSVTETNPVLGSTNNLVLPVSKKDVQVSANYSWSDITGVTVSVSTANTTYTQAPSPTLARTLRLDTTSINQGSLNGVSNPKILVDIHDSRGRTSRFELSFPYYRYIPPEVLSFEASRDKDTATEIYAKSVVSLVSIPDYSVSLEYSINDSPYSMASFVNADRGFLTSLPLGEAFAIKLRLTDNYGFSKIYDNLAVSHSDIMEIYHDRIVFKVPVYDKEGNKVF